MSLLKQWLWPDVSLRRQAQSAIQEAFIVTLAIAAYRLLWVLILILTRFRGWFELGRTAWRPLLLRSRCWTLLSFPHRRGSFLRPIRRGILLQLGNGAPAESLHSRSDWVSSLRRHSRLIRLSETSSQTEGPSYHRTKLPIRESGSRRP